MGRDILSKFAFDQEVGYIYNLGGRRLTLIKDNEVYFSSVVYTLKVKFD